MRSGSANHIPSTSLGTHNPADAHTTTASSDANAPTDANGTGPKLPMSVARISNVIAENATKQPLLAAGSHAATLHRITSQFGISLPTTAAASNRTRDVAASATDQLKHSKQLEPHQGSSAFAIPNVANAGKIRFRQDRHRNQKPSGNHHSLSTSECGIASPHRTGAGKQQRSPLFYQSLNSEDRVIYNANRSSGSSTRGTTSASATRATRTSRL